MNEKGLGKRLQEARQAAGFTQQQLCERANLSFSTLTKIERGAIKSPSIFTIQGIAGALDMSLDDLIGAASLPGHRNNRKLARTRDGVSFIYFDVNGCLVHFYQRAFARIAAETGASANAIETAFWHFNSEVCRGVITMEDFNTASAGRLGLPTLDWGKYYLEAIEPVQEMQEVLIWASKHYKVGLLTNILPGLLTTMRQNGSLPDLDYDAIVDSSEVGAIKPEMKIYEVAAERAGVPPEEILFIDDSRTNLMAGEKLGWHVMWFDDARPDAAATVREALEPKA